MPTQSGRSNDRPLFLRFDGRSAIIKNTTVLAVIKGRRQGLFTLKICLIYIFGQIENVACSGVCEFSSFYARLIVHRYRGR